MDKDKLYQMLDIEEPEDFQYFENIASLLECDEEIGYDDLYALLKDVDKDQLAQLIHDYFEELSDYVPEDATDLFILLDNIKLSLIGMAKNSDEERVMASLTEELNRFRTWYSLDSSVICTTVDDKREEEHTVRDAIALSRIEKLQGDKYAYDFTRCADYPLDEYIMSFADIVSQAIEEDEEKNNGMTF